MKFFILIAILLFGCTTPEQSERVASEPEVAAKARAADQTQEARPWRRDALEAQPRRDVLVRDTPSKMKMSPASTSWRKSDRELPAQLTQAAPDGPSSPGALLHEVTRALDFTDGLGEEVWEITTRLWHEDERSAVGVVLLWGFKDDAVAGSDLRVTMQRSEESWHVEALEERFHCRRGVTDNLCL